MIFWKDRVKKRKKSGVKRMLDSKKEYVLKKWRGKWIREHRWIMEKHLGRKLTENEIVHHIDGNKQNNSLNNLMVMTPGEHNRHHKRILPQIKICLICKKEYMPKITGCRCRITCSKQCANKLNWINRSQDARLRLRITN